MTGRSQTLPWWLGGGGKDDRKQNTLAVLEYAVRIRILFLGNLEP
jgi:hypothetical protein